MTTHTSGAADLLMNTEAGRKYVADFFISIGRHDFADYIAHELAGDFACVLAHALAAEQAVAPSEPTEITDFQVLAITTAYEQGVGKGRQAHASGKEISNPYSTGYRCDLAWKYGYEEGKKQAQRITLAARPAPHAMDGGDAEELRLLRALAFSVERAIGNGVMPLDIEEAYEGYDKWSAARAAQKEGEKP